MCRVCKRAIFWEPSFWCPPACSTSVPVLSCVLWISREGCARGWLVYVCHCAIRTLCSLPRVRLLRYLASCPLDSTFPWTPLWIRRSLRPPSSSCPGRSCCSRTASKPSTTLRRTPQTRRPGTWTADARSLPRTPQTECLRSARSCDPRAPGPSRPGWRWGASKWSWWVFGQHTWHRSMD